MTLTIAQCFGIMPVDGVRQLSAAKLRFEWVSFRCAYSISVAVIGVGYNIVLFWRTVQMPISFGSLSKSLDTEIHRLYAFSG